MKKLMLVCGYLSAICLAYALYGMYQKMAFSSILLMVGGILFIIGYTPFFFMSKVKSKADPFGKFSVALSAAAAVVALIGIYMNIQMTNYAGQVAHIGAFMILIYAIITGFQAFSQKDEHQSLTLHNTAVLLIIALAFFVFIWKSRTSNQILSDFDQIVMVQNQEIKFFEDKSNSTFENLDKSPSGGAAAAYYQKSLEVKSKSDSLVGYLKALGEEMMYKTDNQPIPFDSITLLKKRANRRIGMEMMITEKRDSIYLAKFAEFRGFMESNTNSRGKELLDMFFTLSDTTAYKIGKQYTSWSYYRFFRSSIVILTEINADILHIRMLESETLNYLQTMQARAILTKE